MGAFGRLLHKHYVSTWCDGPGKLVTQIDLDLFMHDLEFRQYVIDHWPIYKDVSVESIKRNFTFMGGKMSPRWLEFKAWFKRNKDTIPPKRINEK